MQRCLQLAKLGEGFVAPNPMVGSVLVHEQFIVGEGYHEQYGKAHAEVNCIGSVSEANRHLIPESTLYVSLEPCVHFGKTPPCADMIIRAGIKQVVIGCRDPFEAVDGKAIEKLKQAGVEVTLNVLQNNCIELNKKFFTFHQHKRPYITLKWAQSMDHFIGSTEKRVLITNEFSNRSVHQLRGSNMAILVGTTTALLDNPRLDTRYGTGPSPIRLVIDLQDKLPPELNVFDNSVRTIIFTLSTPSIAGLNEWIQLEKDEPLAAQIVVACYQLGIQSILVEGGALTLQHFIDAGLWDEAVVITNTELTMLEGVKAPVLKQATTTQTIILESDILSYYKRNAI